MALVHLFMHSRSIRGRAGTIYIAVTSISVACVLIAIGYLICTAEKNILNGPYANHKREARIYLLCLLDSCTNTTLTQLEGLGDD